MKRMLLLCGCVALLCSSAATAQSMQAGPGDAVIRAGDIVRITVWRNADLSGDFQVTPDGSVLHPIYKSLSVAGITLSQADRQIAELLRIHTTANPAYVVELLFSVFVGGQVRQPGTYTVPSRTAIAEAVTEAGGVNDQGRTDRVLLVRDGTEHRVDLALAPGDAGYVALQSGDQIMVEEKRSFWRDKALPAIQAVGSLASMGVLFFRLRD